MNEYCIYVIELDKKVLKHKKFKDANPDYNPDKPCVYVGYSSKTPEQRFLEHTTGARNKRGRLYNKYAKNYGIRLKPRLYKSHNPILSKKKAEAMEVEKARRLRKRGYGVWQN
jgi:hypothetical protein